MGPLPERVTDTAFRRAPRMSRSKRSIPNARARQRATEDRRNIRQAGGAGNTKRTSRQKTRNLNREDEYGVPAWEYRSLEPQELRARMVERVEMAAYEAEDAASDAENARQDALAAATKAHLREAARGVAKAERAAGEAKAAAALVDKLMQHPSLGHGFVPEHDWGDPTYAEDDEEFLNPLPGADDGGDELLRAREKAHSWAATAAGSAEAARAAVAGPQAGPKGVPRRRRSRR